MRTTYKVSIVLVMCVSLIYLLLCNVYTLNYKKILKRENSVKFILYWTDDIFGTKEAVLKKCEVKNCFATSDRSLIPVEKFDAIVFSGFHYNVTKWGVPEKRSSHQVYIYSNQESPIRTKYFMNTSNFYNWTMTYRLKSDVIRTYIQIEKKPNKYRSPTVEEIQKRTRKIAWFVSNCKTPSRREELYDELRKHIDIDIFGKCGKLSCRKNDISCFKLVESNYKFYLSWENSLCDEYVTEKLYHALRVNVVPIVYGGTNYSKVAPPHSVINVMDFKSVLELANYIKQLDANVTEYLKYFEWKTEYSITKHDRALCDICKKLNDPITSKSYENIDEWWRGKNNSKCIDPPQFL